MSTETENSNVNDNNGGEQTQNEDPNIRNLREKAKRTDTVEAENTLLKQRLALGDEGIKLTDKQLLALNAAHDGEQNIEAWRKTAEELNFVKPPEETSTEEQQAHQQVANASTGAVNKGELPPKERYAQANSPQEVLAMVREGGGSVADDIE